MLIFGFFISEEFQGLFACPKLLLRKYLGISPGPLVFLGILYPTGKVLLLFWGMNSEIWGLPKTGWESLDILLSWKWMRKNWESLPSSLGGQESKWEWGRNREKGAEEERSNSAWRGETGEDGAQRGAQCPKHWVTMPWNLELQHLKIGGHIVPCFWVSLSQRLGSRYSPFWGQNVPKLRAKMHYT